jgi:hypothetical protein
VGVKTEALGLDRARPGLEADVVEEHRGGPAAHGVGEHPPRIAVVGESRFDADGCDLAYSSIFCTSGRSK